MFENRVGFDSSEPEDSMYRYGNADCMKTVREITKEEAEVFIEQKIEDSELFTALKANLTHF